jgi:hypothetical protein
MHGEFLVVLRDTPWGFASELRPLVTHGAALVEDHLRGAGRRPGSSWGRPRTSGLHLMVEARRLRQPPTS